MTESKSMLRRSQEGGWAAIVPAGTSVRGRFDLTPGVHEVILVHVRLGTARLIQAGRSATLRRDQLSILDSARSFHLTVPNCAEAFLARVREEPEWRGQGPRFSVQPLRKSPTVLTVATFFRALADNIDALDGPIGEHLRSVASNLVGTLLCDRTDAADR